MAKIVVRARPRGHVHMATQQEGSFCIVSTWDHDKQLFGRALDSNKRKRRASGCTLHGKKNAATLSRPLTSSVHGTDAAPIGTEIFNGSAFFGVKG